MEAAVAAVAAVSGLGAGSASALGGGKGRWPLAAVAPQGVPVSPEGLQPCLVLPQIYIFMSPAYLKSTSKLTHPKENF